MNVQTELLEGKKAKLTIEVPAEEFKKALNRVYNRQKGRMVIPGFRKGKAPRKVIEKMYGEGIFYEDAANDLINDVYPKVYDESELDIVSRPDIEITSAQEGEPFIFSATVALRPDVKLAAYKGVEVTKIDSSVSDEEVEEEIQNQLKTNSRSVVIDGEAQEGDTVVIDYDGFCDGEAFEGGKADGFALELGSHSFVDDFEDQLVGVVAGDEVEVNVTFPEEYHAPRLAGKDAVFIVRVREVRRSEIPELDEEYVEDIGFDSIEEYREDVRANIEKDKRDRARKRIEDEAIRKVAEASEIDVPEEMIETQINSAVNDYANNMSQSGISISEYFRFTGMTIEKLRDQIRPETVDRIRASLVLEEIAKVENIEATDEDVHAKLEEAAERYNMKVEDIEKDLPDSERSSLKKQIAAEKAIELIMDNIVEVEKTEEED